MPEGHSPVHGTQELREEILEAIWNATENGSEGRGADVALLRAITPDPRLQRRVDDLAREGLIRLDEAAGRVFLTPRGRDVARHVVRAHRLAARLLHDLLELPDDLIETAACRLEHALSPSVADSICTLLGHPPTAPDGRPIPPGTCCTAARHDPAPAVHALDELPVGATGRVTFIHPRVAGRLEQLTVLGLVPGGEVRLRQRNPSVVVDVGETTIALDREVARDVFVKPVR